MFYSGGQIVPGVMETLVFLCGYLPKSRGVGTSLQTDRKKAAALLLEGWSMNSPEPVDLPLKGDTVIGNDVWVGQNAVILPGVHIGDGAIIGANSVVGRDIEPYTIVVGNPARVLRKRFDDEMIDLMLRFKWWDKSIESG